MVSSVSLSDLAQPRLTFAARYNDRLPQSALDGAEFAPDQVPDADPPPAPTMGGARSPAALWREDDSEGFYDRTKMDTPRGTHARSRLGAALGLLIGN